MSNTTNARAGLDASLTPHNSILILIDKFNRRSCCVC
jgi:hypothetical protein